MKSLTILLFSIFFANLTFSQERVMKIMNEISKKEIIIKENKRIRIKTVDGQKISGRFKTIGKETILIKNKKIKLANIKKIKRNPLLISIITNGIFIYVGAGITLVGVVGGALASQSSMFLLAVPGAGMIYTGIKSPNLLRGYQKDNNWKYELITTTE